MSNTDKGSREYDDIPTIAGNEAVGGRELPPVYLRRSGRLCHLPAQFGVSGLSF
jgi:hypothetical protein